MSGLKVDADLCVGCGRCVRACASEGIEVLREDGRRVARVTDGCVLCGSCVDACPVDALSVERVGAPLPADARGFWVYCQVGAGGGALPVALELLGRARELADARGCGLTALLPAGADAAAGLIAAGADEVLWCGDERLAAPGTEFQAEWVSALARERRPEAILYGATPRGRELAPAVAWRLGCGLTADCTELDVDAADGLLRQTRPAFGGNLMATIVCPAARPQMATVRPGVFPAPAADPARPGRVEQTGLPEGLAAAPRVRELSRELADAREAITDTDVLVVVGRGIGSAKALPLMERLAGLLGGKLGCTRPVVEAGWLPAWRQVGQTGVSVAPRLLVSLGVSGAIQHLAGIGGAREVMAVNEDSEAPIFDVATYRVVGDCLEVARELVALLEARAEG